MSKHADLDRILSEDLKNIMDEQIPNLDLESQIIRTIHAPQKSRLLKSAHRRYFAGAAAAVILALLCSVVLFRSNEINVNVIAGNSPLVVDGEMIRDPGASWTLKSTSEIQTLQNIIQLNFSSQAEIVLDQETQVSRIDSREWDVAQGRIHFSRHGSEHQDWTFHTSAGVIQTMGTEFDLIVSGYLVKLAVHNGKVKFVNEQESSIISAGNILTCDPNRFEIERNADFQDPWWRSPSKTPWTEMLK